MAEMLRVYRLIHAGIYEHPGAVAQRTVSIIKKM
jgi:hypothetical protein